MTLDIPQEPEKIGFDLDDLPKESPPRNPAPLQPDDVFPQMIKEIKSEWKSCDRGFEDSFKFIVGIIIPMAQQRQKKRDAAILQNTRTEKLVAELIRRNGKDWVHSGCGRGL